MTAIGQSKNMKPKEVRKSIEKYREDYIDQRKRNDIFKCCNECVTSMKWYKRFFYALFSKDYRYIKDLPQKIDSQVDCWNNEYVERMMLEHKAFFQDVEGKALDEQQQRAIVVDEVANLVVAGAGSGKTLTIAAKVKFLCEVKGLDPDDILLLSYTTKAAGEMTDRIVERMGINVRASTFHSLGRGIIARSKKKIPTVEDNSEKIISRYFQSVGDKDICKIILRFIGFYYLCVYDELSEEEKIKLNKSLGSGLKPFRAYVEPYYLQEEIEMLQMESEHCDKERWYAIQHQIKSLQEKRVTIAGEVVRSIEEARIANFLFLNGVNYEYEKHYPFDFPDNYRKEYRPDFYLPDYDIYWEHFGIDKDGNVPWLSGIEESKYKDSIKWKRDLHKGCRTHLIETYSYMNRGDDFERQLTAILRENGIERRPIDVEKIYEILYKNEEIDELVHLMTTFIGLFKSQGYDVSTFSVFEKEEKTPRDELFLEIAKDCFIYYQSALMERETIDFNDMINFATQIVENGGVPKNWKYIIVDEYQDVSVSRYRLLKALVERTGAKILCVGDDWQSIYRFAGSDIKLFTSFDEYWEKCEIMRIEKTYRNSQELINVASEFITRNPAQLKKELKSDKCCNKPIYLIPFQADHFNENDLKKAKVSLGDALELSLDRIEELSKGESCTVLLLGRHGFDKNLFLFPNKSKDEDGAPDSRFSVDEENDQKTHILSAKHPAQDIHYSTVHKAKGLEADYTVIINLKDGIFGFPNQMIDDPVLRFVLSDMDDYQYAEERRLFYVALTRTRNATLLLQPIFKESNFLSETIQIAFGANCCERIIHQNLSPELIDAPSCPKCKTGRLVRRNGPYSEFVGCSNYPICDYTIRNTSIDNIVKRCPECGGFLVQKEGRYGVFYGCSNYPACSYNESIIN